ncbi:MAG: NUDIX domain-containing protein [Neobacillus sp.]
MDIITFGNKEDGKEYILRPAVYCVMFNSQNNKVAIIKTGDGDYFLPGGGIEGNETHEECIKREALEEMGMDIEIGNFIGCAKGYFYSPHDLKYYLSEGYYYKCDIGKEISKPIEEDHLLLWLEPSQAIITLLHEHQSWAVIEALKIMEKLLEFNEKQIEFLNNTLEQFANSIQSEQNQPKQALSKIQKMKTDI